MHFARITAGYPLNQIVMPETFLEQGSTGNEYFLIRQTSLPPIRARINPAQLGKNLFKSFWIYQKRLRIFLVTLSCIWKFALKSQEGSLQYTLRAYWPADNEIDWKSESLSLAESKRQLNWMTLNLWAIPFRSMINLYPDRGKFCLKLLDKFDRKTGPFPNVRGFRLFFSVVLPFFGLGRRDLSPIMKHYISQWLIETGEVFEKIAQNMNR